MVMGMMLIEMMLLTTVMVFVMASLTAVFFFLVDWVIRSGLQILLTYVG